MSGIPIENVVFCSAADGANGKGVVSAKLGLSHFVDDLPKVLKSVYADPAGNSGDLVRTFKGKLFHFQNGGRYKHRSSELDGTSAGFKDYYHAVSGWTEVLDCFNRDSSVFTKSGIEVHRIQIGADGDVALHMVTRL